MQCLISCGNCTDLNNSLAEVLETLSRQRLIRLGGCRGWSEILLATNALVLVFYVGLKCYDSFLGNSGAQIQVITNYFNLEQAPDWHLYQYHVDFNPAVESKRMRIALLCSHEEIIGRTKAFDGMVLFLPKKLPQQVCTILDMCVYRACFRSS